MLCSSVNLPVNISQRLVFTSLPSGALFCRVLTSTLCILNKMILGTTRLTIEKPLSYVGKRVNYPTSGPCTWSRGWLYLRRSCKTSVFWINYSPVHIHWSVHGCVWALQKKKINRVIWAPSARQRWRGIKMEKANLLATSHSIDLLSWPFRRSVDSLIHLSHLLSC